MTQRDLGLFLVIAGVILLAGQLAGHLNDIDAILAGLDLYGSTTPRAARGDSGGAILCLRWKHFVLNDVTISCASTQAEGQEHRQSGIDEPSDEKNVLHDWLLGSTDGSLHIAYLIPRT